MTVRTRFAPSPTGYMHIGNLRTALYAYCVARHEHGQLILRIEDTDRKRNVPKSVQVIYDSLRQAGLDYDEGPDKGGPVGPYVQSQRQAEGIYQHYADLLVERGAAYRCFHDRQTEPSTGVAKSRRDSCRNLTAAEVEAHLQAGDPYVIRQCIPDEGATTFHDLIYGDITIKNNLLDEQILLKSDGFPTYNFANVVDDHLMGITHVLRGVEYLSSTPKYNLLYQAFGWDLPIYVHLPHIVKEGGKKLSKRAGDASFQDLMKQGFLAEAIVNYIALLGWSPGNDREFFTLPELVEAFDIRRINKSKAAFSIEKLEWLNGEHIRSLSPEAFNQIARAYYAPELLRKCDVELTSKVIQSRVSRLSGIPEMTRFLIELPLYDLDLFNHVKSKSSLASSLQVLKAAGEHLSEIGDWREETVRQALMDYAAQANLKTGTVMWPIRVALSGQLMTPGGATEIPAILGKDETLKRMNAAVKRIEEG